VTSCKLLPRGAPFMMSFTISRLTPSRAGR